jgi:hypothetical protein
MDQAAVLKSIKKLSERIEPLEAFAAVAADTLRLLYRLKPKAFTAAKDDSYFFLRLGDRWSRPTRKPLFIADPDQFGDAAQAVSKLLWLLGRTAGDPIRREALLRRNKDLHGGEWPRLDAVLYTIQQSFGCASDLTGAQLVKRYGTIFENLLHASLREASLSTAKVQYQMPEVFYHIEAGGERRERITKRPLQLDLVIGRGGKAVESKTDYVWTEETFCSIKTSSKERIAQVFHDAAAIQRQAVWRMHRLYLLLHNDVQRSKGTAAAPGVGPTFIFGGFMSGARAFPLDGVYFLDLPPNVVARMAGKEPPPAVVDEEEELAVAEAEAAYVDPEVTRKMQRMSRFLTHEVWVASA